MNRLNSGLKSSGCWPKSIPPGSSTNQQRMKLAALAAGGVLLLQLSAQSFAQGWTFAIAPKTNWYGIASSADASKLAAITYAPSGIHISTDGGTNWEPSSAALTNYQDIAISADGTKLIAVAEAVHISTNAGTTWKTSAGTLSTNGPWSSVACSADGTKLVVVGFQGTISSTDSGATWANYESPYFFQVACSADGTKLVAGSSPAGICTSTNLGATWTRTSLPVDLLSGFACSADCTRLVASSWSYNIGGPISISTNFGATWTETTAGNRYWANFASSADGSVLAAGSGTYLSVDAGATWSYIGSAGNYMRSVVLSADGGKLVVAAQGAESSGLYDGTIYFRQAVANPVLELRCSNTNLILSWLVPSRQFLLQSSLAITNGNWTEITTTATPDWGTLRYEVALPKPSATTFYRLVSE